MLKNTTNSPVGLSLTVGIKQKYTAAITKINGVLSMYQSIIISDNVSAYSVKEFGPIVLALAFVLALGGVTAAALIMCGRGHVKSAGVNWAHRSVEIACR